MKGLKQMKRIIILLAALFLAMSFSSCSEQKGYKAEANTGGDSGTYPYLVRTPSATWYLAKDDMEMLGEEAFYDGLFALLDDAEADFADAREALKGFISDETPAVDIYTDFCGKAGIKEDKDVGAYYNDVSNFIKLFEGWDTARAALLHEYVHYLTLNCTEHEAQKGFWAEGAAEYFSNYVCKNRLARSVNLGFDLDSINPQMKEQAWDTEENCLDPKLVYMGLAEIFVKGYAVGTPYFAAKNEMIERTEKIQENPKAGELSFYEAAGVFAYLVETYGEDMVFTHWDMDPLKMENVYEKSFSELYREWAEWNEEQCEALGITIS